ncbi:hypothetical protein D7Y13_03190 [Corallococcus praedator]|uniref:Uncharacterized protein n=2 Tax=Corallococcus TaxID=83461 RepID=A0ABX9QQX5_9BACT|nr:MULTISPECIES: hypothetical protein [Corallococcus]RKH20447.1 hypothetical protein D7X74_04010 [Corallococcus sp. CA047B]RKH34783.1 hypothetical protein D7X75_06885 [Corallococcus sp. CA031C]RKI15952.1 hypothetical protein D7Y13_03190 [Corallococcus praedator]
MGALTLGVALLAPPAFAGAPNQCQTNCNQSVGGQMQSCTLACPKPGHASAKATSDNQACMQRCAVKMKTAMAKCNKKCPKGGPKAKPAHTGHDGDEDHHDE